MAIIQIVYNDPVARHQTQNYLEQTPRLPFSLLAALIELIFHLFILITFKEKKKSYVKERWSASDARGSWRSRSAWNTGQAVSAWLAFRSRGSLFAVRPRIASFASLSNRSRGSGGTWFPLSALSMWLINYSTLNRYGNDDSYRHSGHAGLSVRSRRAGHTFVQLFG